MVEINGFKVIGPTEIVIGKVAEFSESMTSTEFKLVEYYVNEYKTYLNRTLNVFAANFENCNNSEDKLKAFNNAIGNYTRISDMYVAANVMNFLMS